VQSCPKKLHGCSSRPAHPSETRRDARDGSRTAHNPATTARGEKPRPCPLRARQGGEQRGLTVAHGDSGMRPDLRERWSAACDSKPSKLVMRVRFPSPALTKGPSQDVDSDLGFALGCDFSIVWTINRPLSVRAIVADGRRLACCAWTWASIVSVIALSAPRACRRGRHRTPRCGRPPGMSAPTPGQLPPDRPGSLACIHVLHESGLSRSRLSNSRPPTHTYHGACEGDRENRTGADFSVIRWADIAPGRYQRLADYRASGGEHQR
jgi:hypothetical protein